MKRLVTTGFLAAALAGCASMDMAGSPAPAGGMRIATKELVFSDETPSDFTANATRAFVVLDDNDKGKNKKICKAFAKLASATNIAMNPNADPVPTYWLLKGSRAVGQTVDSTDCNDLVANFDLQRAKSISNAFGISLNSHPYILAISPNGKAFYIDIDKASNSQIDKAMTAWFKIAAESTDDGRIYTVWWRESAEKLCKQNWFQTIVSSILPTYTAPVLGLVLYASGCKATDDTGIFA